MEAASLETHRGGQINSAAGGGPLRSGITAQEIHRIQPRCAPYSLIGGTIFRKSDQGRILDTADVRNATRLFGLCPTALVFGLWDSTEPRGGLGAKFQRAIVSKMTGYKASEARRPKAGSIPGSILPRSRHMSRFMKPTTILDIHLMRMPR